MLLFAAFIACVWHLPDLGAFFLMLYYFLEVA